jgi:hypothetical protein
VIDNDVQEIKAIASAEYLLWRHSETLGQGAVL